MLIVCKTRIDARVPGTELILGAIVSGFNLKARIELNTVIPTDTVAGDCLNIFV